MPGFADGLLGLPPLAAQFMTRCYNANITPAQVAAANAAEQTFTVPGLNLGDIVTVSPPGITPGVAPFCARVSAQNTLAITFANVTAGALTPPAGIYLVAAEKSTA